MLFWEVHTDFRSYNDLSSDIGNIIIDINIGIKPTRIARINKITVILYQDLADKNAFFQTWSKMVYVFSYILQYIIIITWIWIKDFFSFCWIL